MQIIAKSVSHFFHTQTYKTDSQKYTEIYGTQMVGFCAYIMYGKFCLLWETWALRKNLHDENIVVSFIYTIIWLLDENGIKLRHDRIGDKLISSL